MSAIYVYDWPPGAFFIATPDGICCFGGDQGIMLHEFIENALMHPQQSAVALFECEMVQGIRLWLWRWHSRILFGQPHHTSYGLVSEPGQLLALVRKGLQKHV